MNSLFRLKMTGLFKTKLKSRLSATKFSAGYGEKSITPPLGADLSGYGFYLDRRAEGVLDDLKVRALYLKNKAEPLILISCDLLSLQVEFSDKVRGEIASSHKINSRNIFLACTHTHTGPAAHPLPGLGEVRPGYLEKVSRAIKEAVSAAELGGKEAEFFFSLLRIEPIGYNRRKGNFEEIDPMLKVGILKQGEKRIFLFNYACHPVVLGPAKQVSADWPGAVIHEIEKKGDRAIFFQGFCGDIDPVTNLNCWGAGTKEDLLFYGKMLAQRVYRAENFASPLTETGLKAAEKRIRLPLQVLRKDEIEKETKSFLEKNRHFPHAERLAEEWKKRAEQSCEEFREKPWLENAPIQAFGIGGLKILGIPGEVFSRIGLNLQKKWRSLLTAGYANGNVGYLPTRSAYRTAGDYAAYCAPKFYSTFAFSPEVEGILIKESSRLLSSISGQ